MLLTEVRPCTPSCRGYLLSALWQFAFFFSFCGCLFNLWLVIALRVQSGRKVQTIPFFSSLKCKSPRRLREKGPGSPSESSGLSEMLLQKCSRNSAAHHLRSQICCTGFLCVRVSFRILHFYFFCTLHSAVLGWNTWLLRSYQPCGPLKLSEASLLSVLLNLLWLTLLHFKTLLQNTALKK